MVPHIVRDPDYLAKKGFGVVDSKQNVISDGTVTPDVLGQLRAGKLFIRQKPGPKNALGLAKFIFPNSYNVYMHDTPATEFFAKSRRDFSHGCIRLEKPADLAAWVLRDNPGWTPERIRAAMNGSTTQQVNLAHPIPVLIVYATVIVLEDGMVRFYDDIYGHDTDWRKLSRRDIHIPDENELPAANATHIHMHEIGTAIVTNAPTAQAQSSISHGRGRNPGKANVDGFRLHVKAVRSHARMHAPAAQKFVTPWRAVSTDHVDLAAGIVEGRSQVVEQVEQVGIETAYLSGTMVAEITVEFVQRFWQIGIAASVNDVEPLPGMCVIKTQPVFVRRRNSRF
jgi:hypothetical protein